MWTADKLIDRIQAEWDKRDQTGRCGYGAEAQEEPVDAVALRATCRFVAAQVADEFVDSNSRRDWINLFQQGIKPIVTKRDIQDWLNDLQEELDDEEMDADIEQRLNEWFR